MSTEANVRGARKARKGVALVVGLGAIGDVELLRQRTAPLPLAAVARWD